MAKGSSSTEASFRAAVKRIQAFARDAKDGVPATIRMVGEEIMTDCKAARPGAGVPVRRGTLRDTGLVEGGTPQNPVVALSFGGAAAPYALVQHERTDFHHALGESRYLVRAVERWRPGGAPSMAALRANYRAGTR